MRRMLLIPVLWLPLASAAFQPELTHLDDLPLHVAPPAVTSKAIDAARAVKGSGPALFAVTVPLDVGLEGGVWDAIDANTLRWRTRVYSATARSLLMDFSRFQLPAGAELRIYDVDGRAVQGPYTSHNNSPEGGLWTATVPGETAVIDLQVPKAMRDQVQLQLGRLGHGYKNERDLGSSGECNIDAICSLGNNWRNEIRSAVKLQIPVGGGFVGVCSGTLVNNLAQNDKPYVLTADHCGIGDAGSPASGVVVYWNFQNSSCGGIPDASDTQNQTGATLRASDRDTDLSLIELNQAPSTVFNVYYAGWDASGTGGDSGVTIHHPSGDAKKISEFTTSLARSSVTIEDGGPSIPAWRVNWSQATTEQGSSGSGLWNQNRQIVGVLSGGAASCDNLSGSDYYARLETQWLANNTAAGQLKAWLDPANTGTRKVAGKNPSSSPTPTPTPTPTSTPTPTPSPTDGGGDGGGGGGAMPWQLAGLALIGLAARRRRTGG